MQCLGCMAGRLGLEAFFQPFVTLNIDILAKQLIMKKIIALIIIFMGVAAGYLYYDWVTKTKRRAVEPSKTLYTWTDEKGVKHFTDKMPPNGAKNIKKTKGYKYIEPPLVITFKGGVVSMYGRVKDTVSDFFRFIIKKRPKKNRQ